MKNPAEIERLFVYGSLAPGEPNERFLKRISGTWQEGNIFGTLINSEWKSAGGYPGLKLDNPLNLVVGKVFSSSQLGDLWAELDEFEGTEHYARVLVPIFIKGEPLPVEGFVYVAK
ncbi:MAG: gamma-glutamylcyclotransferase [Cyclobacteriaceae bacterium]|nr:gamma-glutamylcyclotransferase [Cyclobacteriaceae bacterium]MDX5467526.1 gamma-glutamylcyclotransferase [Cyclobacteriaceae bacterium]